MIMPDAAAAVSADILFRIQRPTSAVEGVDEIGLCARAGADVFLSHRPRAGAGAGHQGRDIVRWS
jgi:hypothetical protein